jgi:ribonucleoside-diphosphate reductase alpha chain
MIELNKKDFEIKKIKEDLSSETKNNEALASKSSEEIMTRPDVVDAKVYKLKSAFVNKSVFITLSYMEDEGRKRPIEIFINSKDLSRSHEYVMLTRLISAVFRRDADVMFILEELQGILDPEGGRFKEGNFYQSLYAEIAEVIERFFYDVGILEKPISTAISNDGIVNDSIESNMGEYNMNNNFKICPACSNQTLKVENGCDVCIQCGYSKCDK